VLKTNLTRLVPAVTRALEIGALPLVNPEATLPKATPLDFKQLEKTAGDDRRNAGASHVRAQTAQGGRAAAV